MDEYFGEDDFPDDDFSGEGPDAPDPVRKALERPLRRKARDIAYLTQALVASLDGDNAGTPEAPPDGTDEATGAAMLAHIKGYMLENGYLLGAKLANAGGSTDFGHRLEMAVLIKRAACELQAQTALVRSFRVTRPEYLNALRAEIEAFRLLFGPWVASFDRTDHHDDGWGLFDRLLPPAP